MFSIKIRKGTFSSGIKYSIKNSLSSYVLRRTWVGCILMCISCHAKSICIDNPQEYAILDQFFKMTFSSEEYGYVLEGSKPISIRNFLALDSFPLSKDLKYDEKQFFNAILIRKAIPLWNKFCSKQKNFVLKVFTLNDQRSFYLSPLEVAFINTSKLKEVVEKNGCVEKIYRESLRKIP